MGIIPDFNEGFISAKVAEFRRNIEKATISLLMYLGEDLVKYAKDNHNYTDRTSNLTNSIGYVVVNGNEIVFDGIASAGESRFSALKVAQQMTMNGGLSYSLIVVAGMNYAAYVEAKGYNVILPAELKAKKDFPAAMKTFIERAQNKANELFKDTL